MTTVPYSSSDYLKTDEDIIEYLNAAVEDGDNSVLLLAMRNVAMAKGGIAKLADITVLNRESLCDNGLPAIHPGEFVPVIPVTLGFLKNEVNQRGRDQTI